jgi:hypothetical protein
VFHGLTLLGINFIPPAQPSLTRLANSAILEKLGASKPKLHPFFPFAA